MLFQHSYHFICDELMTMRLMLTTILWLVLLYLALCAAAWSYQSRLIFPGAKASPAQYQTYTEQQIQLQREGVKLEGWVLTNAEISSNEDAPVLIYFGGNGEDVVTMLPKLEKFGAATTYAFNYRGYGHSEGKATQESLFDDALAIYDYISAQYAADARIVIVGRSLGSAVAGYLATQRDIHGLILLTPLRSAIANGKRMLPFLPVKYLISHPFDLTTMAKDFTCPVLVLIAEADTLIPPSDSQQTYHAITSPKRLVKLSGVGHGNVFDNPNALKAVQQFLT
jgi:pimeloyl-ACP methyl ester carboxylesterase